MRAFTDNPVTIHTPSPSSVKKDEEYDAESQETTIETPSSESPEMGSRPASVIEEAEEEEEAEEVDESFIQ